MKHALYSTAFLLAMGIAPALAEDGHVSQHALSSVGLGGMQVLSDADGLQVRGLSSSASSGGTSLIVGQLVKDTPYGTTFVIGSDVNTAHSSSSKYFFPSSAGHKQGSALSLNLGYFGPSLGGTAGFAVSPYAGIGGAWAR